MAALNLLLSLYIFETTGEIAYIYNTHISEIRICLPEMNFHQTAIDNILPELGEYESSPESRMLPFAETDTNKIDLVLSNLQN